MMHSWETKKSRIISAMASAERPMRLKEIKTIPGVSNVAALLLNELEVAGLVKKNPRNKDQMFATYELTRAFLERKKGEDAEPPDEKGPEAIALAPMPQTILTPEACAVLAYRTMADEPMSFDGLSQLLGMKSRQVADLEDSLYLAFMARADHSYPLSDFRKKVEQSFSGWLRRRLEQSDMKQTELAKRLGIPRSTVSAWCMGRTQPTDQMMKKVVETVGEASDPGKGE